MRTLGISWFLLIATYLHQQIDISIVLATCSKIDKNGIKNRIGQKKSKKILWACVLDG
jgi:hypothetical protein